MTIALHHGDCLKVMPRLPRDSFDACVTDPPYHLASIVKRFGAVAADDKTKTSARTRAGADGYARFARGFMGASWDGGDIALRPETWKAVYDTLRPGAHLAAFNGTKSFARMVCAIEDAGFEVRDILAWAYGSGMPKSHQQHGDWEGWGTGLKPAIELIVLARKPVNGTIKQNQALHGTGAINIRDCRVKGPDADRWPANLLHDGSDEVSRCFPTRFFYAAKASKADRAGSSHPTVKPIALIRYLCRLITPPGGLILDPFAGSGTTGQAAREEGFRAALIEREPQYVADIVRRLRG